MVNDSKNIRSDDFFVSYICGNMRLYLWEIKMIPEVLIHEEVSVMEMIRTNPQKCVNDKLLNDGNLLQLKVFLKQNRINELK